MVEDTRYGLVLYLTAPGDDDPRYAYPCHFRGSTWWWPRPRKLFKHTITASDGDEHEEILENTQQLNGFIAKQFFELFSMTGDTVVDFFCGSGVAAVTGAMLGRTVLAVDIDSKQIALAKALATSIKYAGETGNTRVFSLEDNPIFYRPSYNLEPISYPYFREQYEKYQLVDDEAEEEGDENDAS